MHLPSQNRKLGKRALDERAETDREWSSVSHTHVDSLIAHNIKLQKDEAAPKMRSLVKSRSKNHA